ncbi:hypothetical protein ACFLRF_02475 [Candidatus Altiarchaeota archaeon]
MDYKRIIVAGFILLMATNVAAEQLLINIIGNLKEQSPLVDLIAYSVIIILLILVIFHLHSIDEHLNWIRRIK